MRRSSLLPAALLLAAAAPAMGSDQPGTAVSQWKEEHTNPELQPGNLLPSNGGTDAGHTLFTANLTRGDNPLSTITGVLTPGTHNDGTKWWDADVFCITITNPTAFSVATNGTADRTLALFHPDGRGIAFNDNRTDSATSQGARLTSLLTSSLTPGTYYLAVSLNSATNFSAPFIRNMNRPLDASGGLMFPGPAQNSLDDNGGPIDLARRAEVGPINPASILSGWESFPSTSSLPFTSSYTLTLTGAGYHQLPAPGAAAMLGLGGLLAFRRRRS